MIVTENGIKYRVKKRALLLSILGTVAGTVLISKFLGVTQDDIKNNNIGQLVKIIPSYFLSFIVTNNLIAKTIRFADPIKGQRVSLKKGIWVKRRSDKRQNKARKSSKRQKRRRSR